MARIARIVPSVIAPTKRRLAPGEVSASGEAASVRPTIDAFLRGEKLDLDQWLRRGHRSFSSAGS